MRGVNQPKPAIRSRSRRFWASTSRWSTSNSAAGKENMAIARVASWMGRRPAERPAVLVVDQPAVQPELVGHAVVGQHEPEVADVPLARPEDHRPQRRVQPVGPDHQVEAPPVAAGEGHVDPVRVLGELGDPVAEDVLDSVAGVVVQHLGQVPAQDLDLRDVAVAAVVVGAVGLQDVPVRVHHVRARGVGAGRAHRRVQTHPTDDLLGHPARVHRLPAGTQPGGLLHHGHLGPLPVQPVSQRGPRDARPRHQHPDTLITPSAHPSGSRPGSYGGSGSARCGEVGGATSVVFQGSDAAPDPAPLLRALGGLR